MVCFAPPTLAHILYVGHGLPQRQGLRSLDGALHLSLAVRACDALRARGIAKPPTADLSGSAVRVINAIDGGLVATAIDRRSWLGVEIASSLVYFLFW